MKRYNFLRQSNYFSMVVLAHFLLLISGNLFSQEPVSYLSDPNLTPEVKQFLKGLNENGRPLESLTAIEARKALSDGQASVKVDLSGIEITTKTITTEGFTIPLFVVKPSGTKSKVLPAFIFIHGGGWVLGDFPTHQRLVRDLVVHSGVAAVFVDYTRTPDAVFPRAINEIFAATKWVAAHGNEIGIDGKRLAIAGNSVGGNMTAVTAIRAKESGNLNIKGLVLLWPIVDANFETGSYKQFGRERFLTTTTMIWMFDMYVKDRAKQKEVYASPLNASIKQLRGLPPVLIQVAENDVLRDEGEAFGRKLSEAGVKVTTIRYNGVIHDWGMLNGLATIPETRAMVLHAAAELKEYLK
jgi:acetyl esterase/lipase